MDAPLQIAEPKWVDAVGRRISTVKAPGKVLHELACIEGQHMYINCFDGSMLRLPGNAAVLANGTDGIWMRQYTQKGATSLAAEPWLEVEHTKESLALAFEGEHGMRHRKDSLLEKEILSKVKYAHHAELYKQLLKAWIIGLFFQDQQLSRPAIMFEGPAGAGKSTFGLLVGTWLLGSSFRAENAPATVAAEERRCLLPR